ncbi:MAG: MOSC domain-containing protein, partial [Actinobacteria bacterium]|nr:MOSC domain-containing protein [Actinomycetota bacterium]
MAHVEEIYITDRGGAPMQRVETVDAVAQEGLEGDRYKKRTGYWTGVDECQVTLIEGEALDEIRAANKVHVDNGQHRRNIITRGVDLGGLTGKRFKIGAALFEFDRPRPPCRYIQSVSERGMTRALGGRRGGICAR